MAHVVACTQVAVAEEAMRTRRQDDEVLKNRETSLMWPSGRDSKIDVARSAFVYTSFINVSLVTICFSGLMINFISAFVWSLMKKWMKGGEAGVWEALDKKTIADIVLCYGILKGLLQCIFGFLGDRIGRRWLISGGLMLCVFGLVLMAAVGVNESDPTAGFFIAALCVGFGTGVLYTNLLAAVCDHADPSWRSSALGAYRFWRDMGYAIGALVTGAVAAPPARTAPFLSRPFVIGACATDAPAVPCPLAGRLRIGSASPGASASPPS
jgi:MFS family permease